MNWCKHLGAFVVLLMGVCAPAAAEKILFIPLDNRPVSLAYTADSFRKAGVQVVTPPESLLASDRQSGDPEKLACWLDQEARGAQGAVVSVDSYIYGGLVPSRTHELDSAVLARRAEDLLAFQSRHPGVPLYAFATVMRSPRWSSAPAEPAYYAQYGPQIFRWGQLRDRQRLGQLTRKEKKELAQVEKALPLDIRRDVLERRKKNLFVLKGLTRGLERGKLDYLLIGRDDSAPYSEAHRDAEDLAAFADSAFRHKFRSFSGADELGMVLLNRAMNKARGETPLVYAWYNGGAGPATVPSYEDGPIRRSFREHVLAAGGFPARTDKRADLVLGLYTPADGVTLGADVPANGTELDEMGRQFLATARQYVEKGRNVGIADVAFGNGGSRALVETLLRKEGEREPLGYRLGSYAGWNTAGNSLGYALGQGMLRPYLSDRDRQDLLTVRYLDDWLYQSRVRQEVRQQLIWPNQWPDGKLTDDQTARAETMITEKMEKEGTPLLGKRPEQYRYRLPWHRTFEVAVKNAE
ncbi:DUF4127 family protein [Acidaminococcus fermentans]|uniref:DUF4127 family protein n=1 Tax=Acidaminococcus fermentans TaxID=905 RepID=UPI003F899010